MKSKIFSYAKNASSYFISSIFVAFIGLILNPIYALNLSHFDYAVIGYYSSFTTLLYPLLHFKMYGYYTRQYYHISEDKRENLASTILLSSIVFGLLTLVLFLIVLYFINYSTNVKFPFFPYALLTFIQVYLYNIISFYQTKLRIQRNARQYAILSVSNCIITALFSLLLVVYYKQGASGKLLGALLASLFFALYSFKNSIITYKIDLKILKDALIFSWPLVLSTFLFYFFSGVDRAMLEPIGNIKEFGLYNIGLSIASYLGIFFTTLSNTFLPDLFQSLSQKDYKKLAFINFVIIGFIITSNLIFFILAPYIIDILTSGKFVDAAIYARIFCIHNISISIFYMLENIMIGLGYTKQNLVIRILGVFFSLVMYKILIDNWQFIGAAWGQVISFFILSFFSTIYLLLKYRKKY